MKKSRILLIGIFVAFAAGFMSCGDDTENGLKAPDVTVTAPKTATVGETVDIIVKSSSNQNIVSILFTTDLGYKDSITYSKKDKVHSSKDTIKYIVPDANEVKFAITVTDDEGLSTPYNATITIAGEAKPINTVDAVMMYDLKNPDGGSFYSVEKNQVYKVSEAANNETFIDLVYYYGANNEATICAPNDPVAVDAFSVLANLTTKNPTKLALSTVTMDQFNSMEDDALILANTPTATVTALTKLKAYDVFYFKTIEGKKGLGYVKSISGTTAGSSVITLTLKVQK